jgi:hypothetical protein
MQGYCPKCKQNKRAILYGVGNHLCCKPCYNPLEGPMIPSREKAILREQMRASSSQQPSVGQLKQNTSITNQSTKSRIGGGSVDRDTETGYGSGSGYTGDNAHEDFHAGDEPRQPMYGSEQSFATSRGTKKHFMPGSPGWIDEEDSFLAAHYGNSGKTPSPPTPGPPPATKRKFGPGHLGGSIQKIEAHLRLHSNHPAIKASTLRKFALGFLEAQEAPFNEKLLNSF